MWSPQYYKINGLKNKYDDKLLEKAITQSERVLYSYYNLPSILTLNHLAKRTGVGYNILRSIVSRHHMQLYKRFRIRKRSGGFRVILVPNQDLKKVQMWMNKYILKDIPVHPASCAFKKGNSIQRCASRHCGAKWLIKFDITDFFESISEIQVFRLFKELGYQPIIAVEMARICTFPPSTKSPRNNYKQWHVWKQNKIIVDYKQKLLGYLPQGTPTSPILSNLIMRRCDEELDQIAKKHKLTYTRYSDDIIFSTRSKEFCREYARKLIFDVYKILSSFGYRPQYRKTTVVPPSGKKIVLGLNIEGEMPRLQKNYKDKIRQHLYYLRKFGIEEHVTNRGFNSIWGFKLHLKGMIDYAKMIDEEYAQKCYKSFFELDWPV